VTISVDGGFSVHTASYADELAMAQAMREGVGRPEPAARN
jgi:hypothetical protein